MENPKQPDKVEDAVKKQKEPPEYRRFKRLLKRVVGAPPMRSQLKAIKQHSNSIEAISGDETIKRE